MALAPEAVVFGAGLPRLANTLCIAMPDVAAATQVMALDLAGVMVSAGAACSWPREIPRSAFACRSIRSPVSRRSIIRISFRPTP